MKMDHSLAQRLSDRAGLAGMDLSTPLRDALVSYFELLSRWNAKINLTSLTDPDEAIDRLLVEPVAAAAALPRRVRLMDLGSGGGSPAIPLALALEATEVVMVESRGRKAAFLREAIRSVGLPGTVEAARFEEVATQGSYSSSIGVVSMRAVRMDESALRVAVTFLEPDGLLALFVSGGGSVPVPAGFSPRQRRPLPGSAELLVLEPDVPRGTS